MRILFLGLLLANLGLFAWSQWLAPGSSASGAAMTEVAASAASRAGAPSTILLASERPAAPPTALPSASARTAAGPEASGAIPAADLAAAPAGATATPTSAAGAEVSARRCVSMGPFTELESIAQATAMLKQDGYDPRQRPATGPVPDGYMVTIGQLKGAAEQERVVRRLNRGGLDDAFATPRLDDGYAVSAGLFTEQARAERRVLAVERMGLKATIVARTRPGTVYWIDFDLKTPAGEVGALDPLRKPPDPARKWEVVPCPEPQPVG